MSIFCVALLAYAIFVGKVQSYFFLNFVRKYPEKARPVEASVAQLVGKDSLLIFSQRLVKLTIDDRHGCGKAVYNIETEDPERGIGHAMCVTYFSHDLTVVLTQLLAESPVLLLASCSPRVSHCTRTVNPSQMGTVVGPLVDKHKVIVRMEWFLMVWLRRFSLGRIVFFACRFVQRIGVRFEVLERPASGDNTPSTQAS